MNTKEYIKLVSNKYNNFYDYSNTIYTGIFDRITILCPMHGSFETIANNHLHQNSECKVCYFEKRISKNEDKFLKRSKIVHGDLYNYSKIEFIDWYAKITIICKKDNHGEFTQSPSDHIYKKAGCQKCGKEKYSDKLRLTLDEFKEKSNKIHNYKYNYDKVVYTVCSDKVNIYCKLHGYFSQLAGSHLAGIGCSDCGDEKTRQALLSNLNEFITKANILHNNKYDYSLSIYKDSKTKLEIICRLHGKFLQTPNNHLRKEGCPECGKFVSAEKRKYTLAEFLDICNNVHNYFYDYSLVNYTLITNKINIICKLHGKFEQSAYAHLSGQGCSICFHTQNGLNKRLTQQEFIDKANKIHDNYYDYSKIDYQGYSRKIIIICPKHKEFKQTAHNHLKGQGCYKCCSNTSHKEQKWIKFLNIPTLLPQHPIRENGKILFYVDGYDPITNRIYEFDGNFWHGNPLFYKSTDINNVNNKTFGELYQKTLNKQAKLKELGYEVISIWESEWDEMVKTQIELKTQHNINEAA